MEECSRLPELYGGYREDVLDLLTDILALERQRVWQNISIQKKIVDKIEAAGEHLRRKQKLASSKDGATQ